MSFMKGFGEAFSRSWENSANRRAQQEQDIFKMQYQTYLDNIENNRKSESTDRQNARKAKSLAQIHVTGDNSDKLAAATQIYQWLHSGMSDEQIVKAIEAGGTFQFETAEQNPEMQSQMEQFQTKTNTNTPSVETPEPKQKGGLFGSPYKFDQMNTKAEQKIAQGTGRTPEEIRATLTQPYESGNLMSAPQGQNIIFTPGVPQREPDKFSNLNTASIELAQAETAFKRDPSPQNQERFRIAEERMSALQRAEFIQANNEAFSNGFVMPGVDVRLIDPKNPDNVRFAKVTRGPNGNLVYAGTGQAIPENIQIKEFGKEEQERYWELSKSLAEPQKEYNTDSVAFQSIMREAGDMGHLVDITGGAVLSGRIGNLSQWVQGWGGEIITGMEVINRAMSSDEIVGSNPDDMFKIVEMENKIDELISSGVNDIGTARALYNAKVKILAYKLAAMEGSSGRSLSDREQAIWETLADGGNSPEKFNQNMANLLFSRLDELTASANILNQNNQALEAYEQRFGWRPFKPAQNPEEMIFSDPELKAIYDRYKPYDNLGIRSSGSNNLTSIPNTIQTQQGPQVGDIIDDGENNKYRFKGGNPNDQNNWELIN